MAGLSCEGLVNTERAWLPDAACRGKNVDWFFVGPGEYPYEAMLLCRRCPVRLDCLNYAVENGIYHGIWGGLTPRQRRAPELKSEPLLTAETRRRIAWMKAHGWKSTEIAAEFDISARTVLRVVKRERLERLFREYAEEKR